MYLIKRGRIGIMWWAKFAVLESQHTTIFYDNHNEKDCMNINPQVVYDSQGNSNTVLALLCQPLRERSILGNL